MSADNTEFDDGPAPDPLEAELVAYLDGELDPAAARRVEARLAKDPAARARAAELKRSFDLLDYLPKPEPSPNFTTRTLEKLPAIQPLPLPGASAEGASSGSRPRPSAPQGTGGRSGATPTVSSSLPIPLPDGDLPPAPRWRVRLRVVSVCAAVAVFGALGYFVAASARGLLSSHSRETEQKEPEVTPDPRVIENLPLYAVADDLAFVEKLLQPELFGDEPAVAYDPTLRVPAVDSPDKAGGKASEELLLAYRGLPARRQAEIDTLDAELYAKEPKERDRLVRVLEVYALWLDRLPEAERRGVLGAATPNLRLGVIRDLREQQWLASLAPPLRKKVDALTNPKEKAELIAQLKDDEGWRRDRQQLMQSLAGTLAANKTPWPFNDEARRKEVIEFARAVFRPDEPRHCRLSADQLAEYRRALLQAERDGVWVWYGLTVYELSKLHPYLPEPDDPKLRITEVKELPEPYLRVATRKGGARIKPNTIGRWPEFPLEVARDILFPKQAASLPQLGPARVSEFKPAVRTFATKDLFPKLTDDEKVALQKLEGKWPDYPREFVRCAVKHNLSVPGVTLPGAPQKWDATYGTRRGGRPSN